MQRYEVLQEMRSGLRWSRGRAAAWAMLLVACLGLSPSPPLHSALAQEKAGPDQTAKEDAAGEETARPKSREESIRAITAWLGIGSGATIADVGAGGGKDTWVFADVVGPSGTVLAEEIAEGKVKSLQQEAEKRGLDQVRAVLGQVDDPCLPEGSAYLAFMHYVYHHLGKPREMLRGIRRGLKPGGHLVVVDKRRGTLRDWGPREERTNKHSWIAETTVVREAREEGFEFVACGESHWHADDCFVLAFRRPKEPAQPGQDPDRAQPLTEQQVAALLEFLPAECRRPLFIALGEGRKLIGPLVERARGEPAEIVLEEWATQKDERPALPPNVSFPSYFTDSGDPRLPDEPIDAVFFLDTYHLLFHGETLLAKIHERLAPSGRVYVMDREATGPLTRREASHRRRIEPAMVEREMAAAGFRLQARGPRPTPDRFLMVFAKAPAEE